LSDDTLRTVAASLASMRDAIAVEAKRMPAPPPERLEDVA
jgi:hypothetical protein